MDDTETHSRWQMFLHRIEITGMFFLVQTISRLIDPDTLHLDPEKSCRARRPLSERSAL